ncbi:hypothetical protein [Clostridium grantii]|uniref:DUF5659 domain-containing protein n=1 Tax=Clostridium grantii DSM 8605 TaxID=1121316 RepID=A0A1M5SDD0_9CLOT|nr:hypothetical protein [Clostridium grantii]SHH36597.1 hypothetical protein SAMN02745207_00882 [Clostridium grantii DSM 8605]
MNIKKIFKKQIAEELMKNGNNFQGTEINRNKIGFLVFLFEDTDKLRSDLDSITLRNKAKF